MIRTPLEFDEWPREIQADWLARRLDRRALYVQLVTTSGLDPRNVTTGAIRLKKTEIAAAVLTLSENSNP